MTENEMVGWHHQFHGHELGQTLGDGEGQGSQVCYSPWGCKELDTTWLLNNKRTNTVLIQYSSIYSIYIQHRYSIYIYSIYIYTVYMLI